MCAEVVKREGYLLFYINMSICADYMTLLFLLYYSGLPNDLGDYDETPDVTAQHMKVCLCSHCFNSLHCAIFVFVVEYSSHFVLN